MFFSFNVFKENIERNYRWLLNLKPDPHPQYVANSLPISKVIRDAFIGSWVCQSKGLPFSTSIEASQVKETRESKLDLTNFL